jgi:hypothetical protein
MKSSYSSERKWMVSFAAYALRSVDHNLRHYSPVRIDIPTCDRVMYGVVYLPIVEEVYSAS